MEHSHCIAVNGKWARRSRLVYKIGWRLFHIQHNLFVRWSVGSRPPECRSIGGDFFVTGVVLCSHVCVAVIAITPIVTKVDLPPGNASEVWTVHQAYQLWKHSNSWSSSVSIHQLPVRSLSLPFSREIRANVDVNYISQVCQSSGDRLPWHNFPSSPQFIYPYSALLPACSLWTRCVPREGFGSTVPSSQRSFILNLWNFTMLFIAGDCTLFIWGTQILSIILQKQIPGANSASVRRAPRAQLLSVLFCHLTIPQIFFTP